jgi:hypothetical protein
MKMVEAKDLYDKITIENIVCQIADGWESSHVIAERIVSTGIWHTLPEWDKVIIRARVHKMIRDNKLL